MKTTIKSFLVAAVAATTLFSCAKEIESPEGAVPGNPGDVQISIGLGGGATTYATSTVEKTIHGGNAFLYDSTSKAVIPMTNVTIESNKFTATVPAAGFTSGVTKAKLFIFVNGNITPAAPATLADMKAANIGQDKPLDLALTNGLPAVVETPYVTLTGGVAFRDPYVLKRVASRIGAKTTGTYSDYSITVNKVNLTSGKLFPNNVTDTPDAGTGTIAQRELNGTLTDMFGTSEAVGYVYPSTDAEVVVTPKAGKGEPKSVTFSPKANMNYTVIIVPMVNADGTFENAISIKEWETNEDITVDLNKSLVKVNIKTAVAGEFTKYSDGVSVKAGYRKDNMDIQNLVDKPAGTMGVRRVDLVTTFAVVAEEPTLANPLTLKTETGQSTVFSIATFATPTAETVKTLKITFAANTVDAPAVQGPDIVQYLNIYLTKPESSVEKLLVNIGGNLWMPFNTSGTTAGDEAIAAAILATAGADNTAKIVAYGYANVAQQNKLIGKFFGKNLTDAKIATACPTGYRIAKMADYNALAGNSVVPSGATHWSAGANTVTSATQEFTNSTLKRVPQNDIKTDNAGNQRDFYYTFTAKSPLNATVGAILPFIGNGFAYSEGTPETDNLGGTIIWTGDKVGDKYQRIPFWKNGIQYNEGPAVDVANIRCVKVK